MDFKEFPKIARLSREVIISEKIDGTNACVCITDDGQFLTGSRTRWITPDNDNYGFSAWAHLHREELLLLGVGTHYGEWWGCGIQRRYGLTEKRFSLFNTKRWEDELTHPKCCCCVPVLYQGIFHSDAVQAALELLSRCGSAASAGFMQPEGIVIYHAAAKTYFKKTLDKDDEYKGAQ